LSGTYRAQHTEEGLQAILLACLQLTDEVFEQAVRRHLADTGLDRDGQPLGNWYPRPAQILRQAEEIEQERRRASLTAYQATQQGLADPDQEEEEVQLHLPDEQCRQYGLSPTVRTRRARCPHCADSGMARFYHDRKEHRRVWLAPEFPDLPAAMRFQLDCASAICDCRVGQQRPERAWMATIRYQGVDRQVPAFPLLELIRELASRRQWAASRAIGAA
jgi:hypothetical protein